MSRSVHRSKEAARKKGIKLLKSGKTVNVSSIHSMIRKNGKVTGKWKTEYILTWK